MAGRIRLEGLGIETVEIDTPPRLRALQFARQTRLTMYDATYLALAMTTDTGLASLDDRLAAASSSRVSEQSAPYGSRIAADAASLASLGAALAVLRGRDSAA